MTTRPKQTKRGNDGVDESATYYRSGISTDRKKVGQQILPHAIFSGVTTTTGGVVFTTTADGTVYALDDKTLAPLWSFNAGSFSAARSMTCAVNGKQYVSRADRWQISGKRCIE
jgi:outer membrane protein assembly factor BamB